MGTKTKSLLLAGMLVALCLFGQDARYSQFYASPLTLNPAFTGLINSKYRVAAIFRSQGIALGAPMTTYGSAFDINFKKKPYTNHYYGAGVSLTNDFVSASTFLNHSMLFSGAFHKVLNNRNMLSYGLQMGLAMTRFSGLENVTLPDNINSGGTGYDTGVGNDGGFSQGGMNMDVNTGIAYLGKINRHSLFSGISIYHLLPAKNGLHTLQTAMPMRMSFHGGVKLKVGELYRITPHAVFMTQGANKELNAGANFEVNLPDNSTPETIVSLGSYFRMNSGIFNETGLKPNALIVMGGFSYMDFNFGLAYDLNMSDIQDVSNMNYGFEVSVSYEGMLQGHSKKRITIGCPKW